MKKKLVVLILMISGCCGLFGCGSEEEQINFVKAHPIADNIITYDSKSTVDKNFQRNIIEYHDRSYTLCIWGDTQFLVYAAEDETTPFDPFNDILNLNDYYSYASMVQYAMSGNCDGVLQMGDMTESRSDDENRLDPEWGRTHMFLGDLIESGVFFSSSRGNHDNKDRFIEFYQSYDFGYIDVADSQKSFAYIEEFGGVDQLIISMDCSWPQDDYDWMKNIISLYPDLPTIIHSHMAVFNRQFYNQKINNCNDPGPASNEIYSYILSQPQIYLILGGHYHGQSLKYVPEGRPENKPLFLIQTDFQADAHGGDGWFMRLYFDPAKESFAYDYYNHKYQTGTQLVEGYRLSFE